MKSNLIVEINGKLYVPVRRGEAYFFKPVAEGEDYSPESYSFTELRHILQSASFLGEAKIHARNVWE